MHKAELALAQYFTAGHCADGQPFASDGAEAGLDTSDEGSEELDGSLDAGALGHSTADLLLGSDSDAEDDLIPGGSSDEGDLGGSEDSEEDDEDGSGDEDALHAFEKKARTLDRARWGLGFRV